MRFELSKLFELYRASWEWSEYCNTKRPMIGHYNLNTLLREWYLDGKILFSPPNEVPAFAGDYFRFLADSQIDTGEG